MDEQAAIAQLTNRLAFAFRAHECGNAPMAFQLFQALLPDQTRVLGADHPDTLACRHKIAFCTPERGDIREALRLFEALLSDQT
jgi:hypothetical protein